MSHYKASSEQYRTWNEEHYICWCCFPSEELIAAYRKAGLKCRRLGHDLYLRESDADKAVELNKKLKLTTN